MASSLSWLKKVLASCTRVFKRWKVKWLCEVSRWEGEEKKVIKSKQPKSERIMWASGKVECPRKDGRIFLSPLIVRCADTELWETVRQVLQIAGHWCFPNCQISGCYPVILLVCLNMARFPGKYCRPHYLAIWTVSPRYIFSHSSSILHLQSKDESPSQRMRAARGIHRYDTWMHSFSVVRIVKLCCVLQLSAALLISL